MLSTADKVRRRESVGNSRRWVGATRALAASCGAVRQWRLGGGGGEGGRTSQAIEGVVLELRDGELLGWRYFVHAQRRHMTVRGLGAYAAGAD